MHPSFGLSLFFPLNYGVNWSNLLIFLASSTLPRATTRATDTEIRTDKVTAATSSTSLYDNVGATQTGSTQGMTVHSEMWCYLF